MRYGCQVGSVGLEHDVVYPDLDGSLMLPSVAEGDHPADADHETHRDHFVCIGGTAGKSMKDAGDAVGAKRLYFFDYQLKGLAGMDHHRQTVLLRQLKLTPEGYHLLLHKGPVPVKVDPGLTDTVIFVFSECRDNKPQLIKVVLLHRRGMESHHRQAYPGVPLFRCQHGRHG